MKRMLFVLAALALLGAGLYVYHQNGVEAHRQAAAISKLDQNTDVVAQGPTPAAAASQLKSYVDAHMGASVTYTLQSSYDRAKAAADASQAAAATATTNVYADAQRACSGHTDSITQARCNEQYLAAHPQANPPTPLPQPKLTAYQFTLHSPLWTPDLTGALFLGAAAAAVIAFVVAGRRRR